MDDSEIVGLFWSRGEKAVSLAQEKYGNYGMYIADNVLGNRQDSEECLNDALLAAWRSIPPHRPESLKTYLCKLIREIAVNRRKRRRRMTAETSLPAKPGKS